MTIHWPSLSTPEKLAAIRAVYKRGMTTRKIAAQLPGATRESIVGLFFRHRSALAECELPPARHWYLDPPPKVFKPRVVPLVERHGEDLHTCGKPLSMVERFECRWAVNEAEIGETHLFCGAPTERTYCEHHRSIAYRAPS